MGSRHRNVRHRRYGALRPYRIRPPLPVVTVVCDDTKTAVAYFTEFRREVKAEVTLNVEPAPRCGASADDVLKHAIGLERRLRPRQKGDSAWALLDMEGEQYKQGQAQQAKQRAAGSPVTVLLSKPCFEVWTLAHFIDTGEAFNNCAAVITRLKAQWKKKFGSDFGSKKGQADYAKLMHARDEAVRNAKKRNPERDGSWTEVCQVVEAIVSLCSNS